jgi:5-bromo-4-chloroindolyl phosphate hydrolysis protein
MALRYQKPIQEFRYGRGVLVFLLPLPVLFAVIVSLIKGDLTTLIINTASYGLYLAGAFLIRRGLQNTADDEHRKIAPTPKYPLKTLGAAMVAIATGWVAFIGAGYSFPIATGFGLGALIGCYLLYGFDPRRPKQATDTDGLDTTNQVVQALERAKSIIAGIDQASHKIRNPELTGRLHRITELARQILTVIEEEPKDLRRARKFLNIYLEGAQQVTEGYARTHQHMESQELEDNFRQVLITIEEVFKEQQQKLLENDVLDLDVKIEVLANQLKREGVA